MSSPEKCGRTGCLPFENSNLYPGKWCWELRIHPALYPPNWACRARRRARYACQYRNMETGNPTLMKHRNPSIWQGWRARIRLYRVTSLAYLRICPLSRWRRSVFEAFSYFSLFQEQRALLPARWHSENDLKSQNSLTFPL